jgi:hypothetical protein
MEVDCYISSNLIMKNIYNRKGRYDNAKFAKKWNSAFIYFASFAGTLRSLRLDSFFLYVK